MEKKEKIFKIGIRVILVGLVIFAIMAIMTEIAVYDTFGRKCKPDVVYPMAKFEVVNTFRSW